MSRTIFTLAVMNLLFLPAYTQESLVQIAQEAETALLTQAPSQENAYAQIRQTGVQRLAGQPAQLESLKQTDPESQLALRLLDIWTARAAGNEAFEALAAFPKTAETSPLAQIQLKSQRVPARIPLQIPLIPVALLHPDLRQAIEDYPELYQRMVTLRENTHAKAQNLLAEGSTAISELEAEFLTEYEASIRDMRSQPSMIRPLRNVIAAAQIPSLANVYPMPPTLDPAALLAWEEFAMEVTDIRYKRILVDLLSPIATEASMPCYGLLLRQAIHGFKSQNRDEECKWMVYQLLDYFRDHPSESAAIALARAARMARSGDQGFDLPLGPRLQSPAWTSVLESMRQNTQLREYLPLLTVPEK